MRGEQGGFPWSALCCFCLLAGREGSPSGISAVVSEHLEGCAPSPVWGGEISLDLGSGCPEGSHTGYCRAALQDHGISQPPTPSDKT